MGCNKCGNNRIENKTHNLCADCNFVRIHGKTRFEAAIEKKIAKMVTKFKVPVSRVLTPIKRQGKRIQPFNKDRALERRKRDEITYFEVFTNRPNKCEECGAVLPDFFYDKDGKIAFVSQYSHILSKAAWPQYRNNSENFNRLCMDHHQQWEHGDRKSMKIFESNQEIIQKLHNGSTSEIGS